MVVWGVAKCWVAVVRPGGRVCGAGGMTATQEWMFGGDLLSHPVPRAVPSALTGLASGFGMEPGVSPSLWPPKHCRVVDAGRDCPDRDSGTA